MKRRGVCSRMEDSQASGDLCNGAYATVAGLEHGNFHLHTEEAWPKVPESDLLKFF